MKVIMKFSVSKLIEAFEDQELARKIHRAVALVVGRYVNNDNLISASVLPHVLRELRNEGIDETVYFDSSWSINSLYKKLSK